MPLTRDSHFAGYDPATLRLAIERQNLDTPMARILHRHYDSLGRPLSLDLTTNASPAVTEYTTGYAYDNGGRMQNVWHHPALDATTKAPTGSPTFTYGYTYNQPTAADPRTGAASGSNLKEGFMPYTVTRNAAGANPALTANRTYEATRDALHTIENKAGINVVSSYTYGVNSITQRESVTTAGTAFTSLPADWAWHYDSLGQVIHADHANINTVDRRYEYDTIGNRTKTAIGTASLPTNPNWVSNALNQYTTVNGTVQPTTPAPAPFDADGNMTAGPIPGVNGNNHGVQSPGSATAIKWDAENRLISMRIGTPVFSYTYDHHSRLITRATNGTVNTRYSYDGWNRIAQYNNTTLQDTFTWGLDLSGTMQGAGGVGGLLATRWVSSSNTDYFPTYDGNGNVSEYLTTTGTTTVHYEYDPFGTITRRTGSTSTRFVYRFSTKPRDINSGLYYYGYRWYDTYSGRWPSRDPIEEEGGINLYGFVGNDVLEKIDVLGLQIIDQVLYEQNEERRQLERIKNEIRESRKRVSRCCNNENIINDGEKTLNERYKKIESEFIGDDPENPIVPRFGPRKSADSCIQVNSNVMAKLSTPIDPDAERSEAGIPVCWDCHLENRRRPVRTKLSYRRVDHWVVICTAANNQGEVVKEITFDYWNKFAIPGEDPNSYFRQVYPNPGKPNEDFLQLHQNCVGDPTMR